MKWKQWSLLGSFVVMMGSTMAQGVTPVPNAGFEEWVSFPNYEDPLSWDSPNEEISAIPLFGTTVVTKSTDHYAGSFSARLETKEVFLVGGVPGFLTCGEVYIDLSTLEYVVTGGAPVYDSPTHLKGYYKYLPKGGDSCAVGIGLFKTFIDTVAGNTTIEVGVGYFSTKDTVSDWTYFSAWIDYYTSDQPDTMNIIALSSAQEEMTPGSVLFIDDLFLDYTVNLDPEDPSAGINIYHDKETRRVLVFLDFEETERVRTTLYSMTGQPVVSLCEEPVGKGKMIVHYSHVPPGIYILEVIHNGKRYVGKYFLD